MDEREQASFEPRAVLARRRAGWNRLAILVPALAFAIVAWAGLSGPRSSADQVAKGAASTAPAPSPVVAAPSSLAPQVLADYPAQVVGLEVQRFADIQPWTLGRDTVVALAGWYVATEITDCPPLAAIYRDGALPDVRGDTDSWAFCDRSGVLYGSQPDMEQRLPTNNVEDNGSKGAGLPAVPVALVIGVVVPQELEVIGSDATPVVVVGRFVQSPACEHPVLCRRELIVDHVAWAAGVGTEQITGAVAPTPGVPRLPADGVNVLTGG
jgi:hypothetical protein